MYNLNTEESESPARESRLFSMLKYRNLCISHDTKTALKKTTFK